MNKKVLEAKSVQDIKKIFTAEQSEDYTDYGFAIITGSEDLIKDNARDAGRILDDKAWKLINRDVNKIEKNMLKVMNNWAFNTRDEGHDNTDALIGTLTVKTHSPAHDDILNIVEGGEKAVPATSVNRDFYDIWKGTSKYGQLIPVEISFWE